MKFYMPLEPSGGSYCLTDKTIVLDIDSTILHTFTKYSKYENLDLDSDKLESGVGLEIESRIHVFAINDKKYWSVLRPGAREFLLECYSIFKHVIFWTAGTKPYAKEITRLLHLYGPHPDHVFSRDDIKTIYDDDIPIKDLNLMIQELRKHKIYIDIKDILTIDDVESTFSLNKENGILIPKYEPEATIEDLSKQDDAFDRIMSWILVNINKDVTCVSKNHIFV